MAAAYERFGARLLGRLLAPEERSDLPQPAERGAFLARRFAAKEAALKALGTGLTAGIRWRDIRVGHSPGGAPDLIFSGQARMVLERLGPGLRAWLSISDERRFAVAVVVLERP